MSGITLDLDSVVFLYRAYTLFAGEIIGMSLSATHRDRTRAQPRTSVGSCLFAIVRWLLTKPIPINMNHRGGEVLSIAL